MTPTLDVVVVTYRSTDTIEKLIRSLPLVTSFPEVNLFVHDNAGDRGLIELVERLAAELGMPIFSEMCSENCGFARACNRLAGLGSGDWILFINPDAEISYFPDAWVPEDGIWGPEIVDEHGRMARLYGPSRRPIDELRRTARVRSRRPSGRGYVSGACLLIDRQSFIHLDGFDEHFYMFYEDIDLGLRASAAGIPVHLNSDWIVEHVGGHSSADGKARVFEISARSSVFFHAKHGHAWRLWATWMGLYFRARHVAARLTGRGASEAYRSASRQYIGLVRTGPDLESGPAPHG